MVATCNLQSAITASKLNLQGALTPLTQLRARHPLALKRGQAEVAITPFLARYHNFVLTSKASLRKRHALHVVGQGDQTPVVRPIVVEDIFSTCNVISQSHVLPVLTG